MEEGELCYEWVRVTKKVADAGPKEFDSSDRVAVAAAGWLALSPDKQKTVAAWAASAALRASETLWNMLTWQIAAPGCWLAMTRPWHLKLVRIQSQNEFTAA